MRAAAITLLLLGGTASLLVASSKIPPWEKPLQVGRNLYRENCIVCHDIDKAETKKLGPSLFRLFQNEKLPFSGGTPSKPYVDIKIRFGGDVMPAFVNKLTPGQIKRIIEYIQAQQ